MDLEGINELDVCPRDSRSVFGLKHLLLFERADSDALRKRNFDRARPAILNSPPHTENITFQ